MSKLERNPSLAKKSVQFPEPFDNLHQKIWQNPQITKFCILVFNQSSMLAKSFSTSPCPQHGKSKQNSLFWRSPFKLDPAGHSWYIPWRQQIIDIEHEEDEDILQAGTLSFLPLGKACQHTCSPAKCSFKMEVNIHLQKCVVISLK